MHAIKFWYFVKVKKRKPLIKLNINKNIIKIYVLGRN